jgi:hypothetical protein
VLLNNVLYGVLPLDDEHGHTYAFLVVKEGTTEETSVVGYQVTTVDWECDCPDATYRERACKHARFIRRRLAALLAEFLAKCGDVMWLNTELSLAGMAAVDAQRADLAEADDAITLDAESGAA